MDSSVEMSGRTVELLRQNGRYARSVSEIFGRDPGDMVTRQGAKQIGARVLTADKGRQLRQGLAQLAIPVQGNPRNAAAILRIVENEGL